MVISTLAGLPANGASADPLSDARQPVAPQRRRRITRPAAPLSQQPHIITVNRPSEDEGNQADTPAQAPSTSRARTVRDEIALDPAQLNQGARLSTESTTSGLGSVSTRDVADATKYLDIVDLKNYLMHRKVIEFARREGGLGKLKDTLHQIEINLPNRSASRKKIHKLLFSIPRTMNEIQKNHGKYVELLEKRRIGGWRYAIDFKHHLRSKDSTAQFIARAAIAATVMGSTSLLLQITYASLAGTFCRDFALKLGASNTTSPMQAISTNASTLVRAEGVENTALDCNTFGQIRSAFLAKDATPGAAVGADLGINLLSGTLGRTLDGLNEVKLQSQSRDRGRNGAQSIWHERGYSTAKQAVKTYALTSGLSMLIDGFATMVSKGELLPSDVARGACVHGSKAIFNTAIDAARDAFLPDASSACRLGAKVAGRIALVQPAVQMIRSALNGEDFTGFLSNILAYGIVIGASHEIESAAIHALREANIPPHEQQNLNFLYHTRDINKLVAELKNDNLIDEHNELADDLRNEPGMRALIDEANATVAAYLVELMLISEMLPGSPELQDAARSLDTELGGMRAPQPTILTAMRNAALGAPQRERDIELGVTHREGERASSHGTVEVENENVATHL